MPLPVRRGLDVGGAALEAKLSMPPLTALIKGFARPVPGDEGRKYHCRTARHGGKTVEAACAAAAGGACAVRLWQEGPAAADRVGSVAGYGGQACRDPGVGECGPHGTYRGAGLCAPADTELCHDLLSVESECKPTQN